MDKIKLFFSKYREFKGIIISIIIFSFFSLFALIMLGKGIDFTRYNLNHINYSFQLENKLERLSNKNKKKLLPHILKNLYLIKEQPVDCINSINFLDLIIMKIIDTEVAYDLCVQDLIEVDKAIMLTKTYIGSGLENNMSISDYLEDMNKYKDFFLKASSDFKVPVKKTVEFIKISMMITILLLALFTIIYILITFDRYINGLKLTAQNLNYCVSRLNDSSYLIIDQGRQLEDESLTLKQEAERTASATQETSSTIHEINSIIGRTLEAINKCNEVYSLISKNAEEGKLSMQKMDKSIKGIEKVTLDLNEINEIIQSVKGKIDIITEIAFSTKLISFNASVEAARAGEFGKGFSVVADEIGDLARTTTDSSAEILELIEGSETKVSEIIQNINNKSSGAISQSVDSLGAFEKIYRSLKSFEVELNQIQTSSQEQKESVVEVVTAIQNINTATQKNLVISEKVLNISRSTGIMSNGLSDISKDIVGHMEEIDKHLKNS